MDKNTANILLDTEFEENNEEEYTTIIESYRCSTSTYNHQNSIYSLKTSPITPPPKSQIINYKKKSSDSLEKLKSNHILINNLNECIENLKIMLSKKKSSQNVPKHTNKNFKLNDENKDYDISDVSSFDLNEENL
jgi:exosome complex RNA-binding protein Csl4